ncbi:MAG: hypothetical protein JXR70_15980 [Spirochaetales bacterium]|nr:hypothetical protein [Spirochaetales bacterium]
MKKLIILFLALALFGAMVACVSEPPPAPVVTEKPEPTPEPTLPPPPPPQIIEHKTSDFGGNVPNWVDKTALQLEKDPEFNGYYVFIIDQSGKDLNGVKIWATNFVAQDQISRMISNRVQSKFVGAAAGDSDMLETYMESVVKSVSQAEFSGVRINDEFWIKKRYFDQEGNVDYEEYRYLFLITVPKKDINDAIERAFDGTKPKTEEEKSAMDRVKDAFGEGLD